MNSERTPLTWRDWFPWPIGTHWCIVDAAMWSMFVIYVGAVLVLLVIDWLMQLAHAVLHS